MEHAPVLLQETLEYLALRPHGIYVDATAGLGGHTAAIAARLTAGRVIACDRDPESLEVARQRTAEFSNRITFVHAAFSELKQALTRIGIAKVSGLVADLGVSRYQLTEAERGFSITADGLLDMRMDRSRGPTAAEIVNTTAEKALAGLIYQFGEERRARRIARAIVRARPLHTTQQLARVVERAAPRTGRLHPGTKTFMAIRIAVNRELEELDALLEQAPDLVESGGRIVVLSFHSLEDRKVKQAFQRLARAGRARILTRHVVRPSEQEMKENAASRSAKLRAVETSA